MTTATTDIVDRLLEGLGPDDDPLKIPEPERALRKDAAQAIKDLREELDRLKKFNSGVRTCPECKREFDSNTYSCPVCPGAPSLGPWP